jgi:hypothetical protein
MRRLNVALLLLAAGLATAACGALLDIHVYDDVADSGVKAKPKGEAGSSEAADAAPGDDASVDGVVDGSDGIVVTDGPTVCPGTCAPPVPAGWTGPLDLYSGPSPAPSCPTGSVQDYTGYGDVQGDPAQCACPCVPTGGQCDVALTVYKGTFCQADGGTWGNFTLGSNCIDLSQWPGAGFSGAIGHVIQAGSCATDPASTVPQASWHSVVSCAPQHAGTCASGVCVSSSPAGFSGGFCIRKTGAVGCPPGAYSHQSFGYKSFNDTRGCGPCSCGPLSAPSYGVTVRVYSDSNCQTPANIDLKTPISCESFGGTIALGTAGQVTAGHCDPGSSTPTGSTDPVEPMTFCCTQ